MNAATFGGLVNAIAGGPVGYDAFAAAIIAAHVTHLPSGVTAQQVVASPTFHDDPVLTGAIGFDVDGAVRGYVSAAIDPLMHVKRFFTASAKVTQLYTTLRPSDMTTDPVFAFANVAPDVSSIHAASITSTCVGQYPISLLTGSGGPEYVVGYPVGDDVVYRSEPMPTEQMSPLAQALEVDRSGWPEGDDGCRASRPVRREVGL